jgi:hypothetical protein
MEKMVDNLVKFKAVTDELAKQDIAVEELKELSFFLWFYWDEKVPEGLELFRCALQQLPSNRSA